MVKMMQLLSTHCDAIIEFTLIKDESGEVRKLYVVEKLPEN